MFLTNNSTKKIFPLYLNRYRWCFVDISVYIHIHSICTFYTFVAYAFKCIAYTVNECYRMLIFIFDCNFQMSLYQRFNTFLIFMVFWYMYLYMGNSIHGKNHFCMSFIIMKYRITMTLYMYLIYFSFLLVYLHVCYQFVFHVRVYRRFKKIVYQLYYTCM